MPGATVAVTCHDKGLICSNSKSICDGCGFVFTWYYLQDKKYKVYVTEEAKNKHIEIFGDHGFFHPVTP